MRSAGDNETPTRVGSGTPMGNLMRQDWLTAVRSEELPDADGDPLRVCLLGEDLIMFRDSQGRIGLLANSCPHRGASLFYERNEEGGVRCVYHGWKYDATGQCLDMPSEPPRAISRTRKQGPRLPVRREGGDDLGVHGPARNPTGDAALRVDGAAGQPIYRDPEPA